MLPALFSSRAIKIIASTQSDSLQIQCLFAVHLEDGEEVEVSVADEAAIEVVDEAV